MHHDLKSWPVFFEKTWAGLKPWEIRKNDRDFHIGDTVTMHEWNPQAQEKNFTGRWVKGTIAFMVLELESFGLKDGFGAFTFQELERGETGGGIG